MLKRKIVKCLIPIAYNDTNFFKNYEINNVDISIKKNETFWNNKIKTGKKAQPKWMNDTRSQIIPRRTQARPLEKQKHTSQQSTNKQYITSNNETHLINNPATALWQKNIFGSEKSTRF